MSGYIPNDHVTIEWQGDTITCDMEPITNADFSKLMPFYHQGEDGVMTLRFEEQMDFARVAGEMLPRYVTNFGGLKDARGNDVPFDTVLEKMYFMPLKSELVGRLFALSTVSGDDEKKSGELSAQGLPEQAPDLSQ